MTVPAPAVRGARLVTVDGRALPLRSVALTGRAGAGLARVEARQDYRNPHAEPLNVTYTFPLPPEAAVAGYEIRIGERVIRGEIDRRAAARERFDRALLEGRTAGLLDQERPNVFTQHVGNVPPGADVSVALTLDQPLSWVDGGWEWRFPTVVAPRYAGSNTADPERIEVDVADGDTGVRASIELVIEDELASGSNATAVDGGVLRVTDARLDRDVVVRWPVALPDPGVALRTARPRAGAPHGSNAYGLLTIVPPAIERPTLARDVVVLIDTSGSMSGAPLRHAKDAVLAVIESLDERDRLEMTAFASRPVAFSASPVEATPDARRRAAGWVRELEAGGATEMVDAIDAALAPLRPDAQRQVVLVSDGLIGFESEAIARLTRRLPAGSRLHAVGVGSAANRGFMRAAARAGRGVEIQVDLHEAPAAAAERIVAATRGPAIVDVAVEGGCVTARAPRRPLDLMAGAPVRVGLRLRPEGGEITVRGRAAEGEWSRRVVVPPVEPGAGDGAVIALYGRELVEDLELDLAAGAPRENIDDGIERAGLEFGISTRLTSWVAVDSRPGVDPRQPVRVERVPQELAFGMSAEGLGLRSAMPDRLSSPLADVMLRRLDVPPATTEVRSWTAESFDELVHRRADFEPPRGPMAPPRELVARARVQDGPEPGVVVVEFRPPVDLELPRWRKVVVVDGGNNRSKVRVEPKWTTRSGHVWAGSLVRIAMRVADLPLTLRHVVLRMGGVTLRLDIAEGPV